MTFALEFDTDDETQRVIRVSLLRWAAHCEDEAIQGDERAKGAAEHCLDLLSWEEPWGVVHESSVGLITTALRHEIDHGFPGNADKAQEIIEKVDERFRELFRNLPPGAII